jgi:hypothetical protein
MRKVFYIILIGFISLSLTIGFFNPSLVYASHEDKTVSQSQQKQEDKGILQSVGEFLSGAKKLVGGGH